MKTLLVPTDFSVTGENALKYAVAFARQVAARKLIIYHAYQAPASPGDPMMPSIELLGLDEIKKAGDTALEQLVVTHRDSFVGFEVATINEYNLLTEGINDVCQREQVDLVIMGITAVSEVEETLFGSNAVNVAKNITTPVLIIPQNVSYVTIDDAVFACDYKQVAKTTPVQPITRFLKATSAQLSVLHVDAENEHLTVEQEHQRLVLDYILEIPNINYVHRKHEHFVEGINAFVESNKTEVVITIPKKLGWFEGLFAKKHSKELAFHSKVPVLMVHD